jgi:anti-sigma28 factor (negative regulator of flagellin synthesis)
MRISAIQELLNPELKKADAGKKVEPVKQKTGSPDRTELSSNGQQLAETKAQVGIIASQVDIQPEIRPEKVAEVKQKIVDGFYETPEFVDKLADKLAKEFGAGTF